MLLLFSKLKRLLLWACGLRSLKNERSEGSKGLLMDWCLFIPIKNKFCKLHLDVQVDVLICHFQWKASFLLSVRKAVDDWG